LCNAWSAKSSILQTAGGIARALRQLDMLPYLNMYDDVTCDYPFELAASIARQMRAAWLLTWCVVVHNPDQQPDGDLAIDTGRLDCTRRALTFSGIGIYEPSLFSGLDPNAPARLAPLLRAAAERRLAGAERYDGRWLDVGTPQRLAELDAQLRLEQ